MQVNAPPGHLLPVKPSATAQQHAPFQHQPARLTVIVALEPGVGRRHNVPVHLMGCAKLLRLTKTGAVGSQTQSISMSPII